MHYVISVLQPYTCTYSTAPPKDAFFFCCSEFEGVIGINEQGTFLLEYVCILPAAIYNYIYIYIYIYVYIYIYIVYIYIYIYISVFIISI